MSYMKLTSNPPPPRGVRKRPEQYKKLASLLAQNAPVGQALRESGWSDIQAKKGWDSVPAGVLAQLPKKGKRLAALGKGTDKETRKHIVRGRLIENAINGKDGGAMSAKILGSDRELGMWEPETATGIVVLSAPREAFERKAELLGETGPVNGK